MSFLDAGPLHDAEVCSQMPQVARLATPKRRSHYSCRAVGAMTITKYQLFMSGSMMRLSRGCVATLSSSNVVCLRTAYM
jgi:hypothetical protein